MDVDDKDDEEDELNGDELDEYGASGDDDDEAGKDEDADDWESWKDNIKTSFASWLSNTSFSSSSPAPTVLITEGVVVKGSLYNDLGANVFDVVGGVLLCDNCINGRCRNCLVKHLVPFVPMKLRKI